MSRVKDILASLIELDKSRECKAIFELGGSVIEMTSSNEKLLESFFQPLSAGKTRNPSTIDFNIHVSQGNPLIANLERVKDLDLKGMSSQKSGRVHTYYIRDREEVLSLQYENELLALDYYSSTKKESIVWINSKVHNCEEDGYFLTAPLRTIFAWYFHEHGSNLIHASAVGDESFGLMMVGPGGSGKTNLALRLAKQGLGYLGDDSVLVSRQNDCKISSIYSTARIYQADLLEIDLGGEVKVVEKCGEKSKLYFSQYDKIRLQSQSPLSAVVTIRLNQKKCSYRQISFMDGFVKVAPNSMMHIPAMGQSYLRSIADTLKDAPWYEIAFSKDCDENTSIAQELVAEARQRQ